MDDNHGYNIGAKITIEMAVQAIINRKKKITIKIPRPCCNEERNTAELYKRALVEII